MRRVFLFLGSVGVGGVVFGLLVSGVGWEEIWRAVQTLSVLNLFAILLFTGGFFFLGALRWYFILKHQKCTASFLHIGKTYLGGLPFLFLVPMFPFANEIFRASSLKKEYGIDFSKGMASVTIDRILELTSNLFVILVGGGIFLFLGSHISYSFRMVGIIGFVGLWFLILSFLYIRLFQGKGIVRIFRKDSRNVESVEKEILQFFRFQNASFWAGVYVSLGRIVMGVLRAWAIILFFEKGFALLPAITIHGFYYLAVLVPIPVALGSHEALQAAAFGAFGLGIATGAAFAFVVRTADLFFVLIGLPFVFYFGFSFLESIILQRGNVKDI